VAADYHRQVLRREPAASRRLENLVTSGLLVIEKRCSGRDNSQLEDLNFHPLLLGRGPVSGTAGDVPRKIIKYYVNT